MRKGFSLLTAIIFLILVATLGALAITLSTQSTKQTTDIFLKTQAELLLRSGTEYALLALSAHDYNGTSCLNSININYPSAVNPTHDINISISYIGNGLPIACTSILSDALDTNESNRTVIIDAVVSTKQSLQNEQIRLHRRTIQKP